MVIGWILVVKKVNLLVIRAKLAFILAFVNSNFPPLRFFSSVKKGMGSSVLNVKFVWMQIPIKRKFVLKLRCWYHLPLFWYISKSGWFLNMAFNLAIQEFITKVHRFFLQQVRNSIFHYKLQFVILFLLEKFILELSLSRINDHAFRLPWITRVVQHAHFLSQHHFLLLSHTIIVQMNHL